MNWQQVRDFLDPQFGYLAKSSGEQLSAHHFTCWSVFTKIASFIPSLNEREKELLEIACLIHDIAKTSEKNQRILRGRESGQVIHKPIYENIAGYIDRSSFSLSDEDKKTVFDIVLTHHSVSNENIREITIPSAGILTELLRYSDWIASMDEVRPETIGRIRDDLSGLLDLTFTEISRFPSPSTYLALKVIIGEYKNAGWEPLLLLDNGAIFIGKQIKPPLKNQVIDKALEVFFDQSLGVQSVYSPNFTKNFLGGLSQLFPASFMKAKDHKEKIIDNLSDIERKGIQFLRLLSDILPSESLSKIRRELPIWNLIPACLGPSGHPKAKRLWFDFFSEEAPSSINAEAINRLFSKLTLKETIPSLHLNQINSDWHPKRLSELKSDQLFEVLYSIAFYYEERETGTQDLRLYLDAIISMEEEKDFESISKEIFRRYKKYKSTFDVSKGLCERCGCTVPILAQPALKFKVTEGWSQVRTKSTGGKAVCLFCAYDSMILKEKGEGIYLRISSKIPDLLSFYPEISSFIAKLESGLRSSYQIAALEERDEFCSLPFPKKIRVPLPQKETDQEAESILRNEQGILFKITNRKDSGSKDLKVKYESLYHILNLLGFKVDIGAEEQIGLLGKRLITTIPIYYRSLAIRILAGVLRQEGKKKKEYIFASELFEKSPSIALRKAADAMSKNNKPRRKGSCPAKGREKCKDYNQKGCNCIPYNFFYFTLNGIEEGGDDFMRKFLEDAAFLADKDKGIPHFCVEPEKRENFWKGLSKHSATKPVAQALDELMMGRGIEYALERFLRNISKKIGEKEQDDLKSFVDRTKELFKGYETLRKENITSFIRAKNALCSAVYVFTRYQNLREVVKNGN